MSIQLNWTPIISVTNSFKVLNFHTIWSSWTWTLVVERSDNKNKCLYSSPKTPSFQVYNKGQNNTYWNPNEIICPKIYIGSYILPPTSSSNPWCIHSTKELCELMASNIKKESQLLHWHLMLIYFDEINMHNMIMIVMTMA